MMHAHTWLLFAREDVLRELNPSLAQKIVISPNVLHCAVILVKVALFIVGITKSWPFAA
jgi:hypothetical protein